MHNGSAVQKLWHSSNPQPPALRRQASSTTSVLVLKERRPDCILQQEVGAFSALGGVASAPGGMVSVREARPQHWGRGSVLGGVVSAPGGKVSVREAWPPALGGIDTTGRCGLCTGRCGLCASRRGLWVRSPGLCERRGLCTGRRGLCARRRGLWGRSPGLCERRGLCARRRGLCTGGGALYWEAWPLHFSGPLCRGAEWVLCNLPVSQKEGGIPSVSGTREAQASAVRAFSQERSGLFPNMWWPHTAVWCNWTVILAQWSPGPPHTTSTLDLPPSPTCPIHHHVFRTPPSNTSWAALSSSLTVTGLPRRTTLPEHCPAPSSANGPLSGPALVRPLLQAPRGHPEPITS